MQIGLCQRVINARRIGSEGAAALQQQGDALERRALRHDMTLPVRTPVSSHKKHLPQHGVREATPEPQVVMRFLPADSRKRPLFGTLADRGRIEWSYIYVRW